MVVTAALGALSALGISACGDDERGGVQVEGAGTSTSGDTPPTVPTNRGETVTSETSPPASETAPPETDTSETAP